MSEPAARPMPLFYRDPQPLIPASHHDMRLTDGDYGFAAQTNVAPLTVIEFAPAQRDYPIVFSEGQSFPIAVLGLTEGNRFVAEGRWTDGVYVPAYVRRYPFVFAEATADSFALALDMASERVAKGGDEGAALFADGKPAPLTEAAMAFCREFHGHHLQTQAFVAALTEQALLVSQQADAKLASGMPLKLGGFMIVDREKFSALPNDVVLDWHRKGWLALVHFHLNSLDRFADLLGRESATARVTEPSPEPAKPAAKSKTAAKGK